KALFILLPDRDKYGALAVSDTLSLFSEACLSTFSAVKNADCFQKKNMPLEENVLYQKLMNLYHNFIRNHASGKWEIYEKVPN
ncbi:hypothetical protein ACJX0J_017216, partial [Zea mays]